MGTASSNELFKYLGVWKGRLNCWNYEKILARLGTLGGEWYYSTEFLNNNCFFLKEFCSDTIDMSTELFFLNDP